MRRIRGVARGEGEIEVRVAKSGAHNKSYVGVVDLVEVRLVGDQADPHRREHLRHDEHHQEEDQLQATATGIGKQTTLLSARTVIKGQK